MAQARKGRRSRLTKRLTDDICGLVERGATEKIAYTALRVPHRTFYRWKAKGRDDAEADKKTAYAQFYDALEPATAQFEITHIENIAKASKASWQASAWLLERKYPERYARRQTIDMVMDWPIAKRTLDLIKDQLVTFAEVTETFGDDLANQLFEAAGIAVTETSGT